jgi:hypothetical protein
MTSLAKHAERRLVQRIRLAPPLRATIDGQRSFIVDLSLRGLRVIHQEKGGAVGSRCVIRAEWDGHPLELHCAITRTFVQHTTDRGEKRTVYHTGLTISRAMGASAIALRRVIEHYVELALDEQRANARGIPCLAPRSVKTGAPTEFVRHEYRLGRWREVTTPDATQPDHGFTLCAQTAPDEVEMLRRAYERAVTDNDVSVIRRLAALSVNSSEIVQARRYTP